MFIIGTAGHIDHGKSSLIKRLTGIDPDRLPEEKQRGMTIDLGFAWYDLADGRRIGIVDVPGHERFARNMIAGAGGIDAVLLVVAADDGWMPQSQEHLQITGLLGVKYGIVVVSKIDLVEKAWVGLVKDELKERLKGTFLENAPVIGVSSVTGEGIDELKREIAVLANIVAFREDFGKPRLYIDRSFVLAGMGGVATGTLRGGILKVGQEAALYPSRTRGKIRTLQSHNQRVDIAYPGQRTAVSLTGVDKESISRGSTLSTPEIIDNYPDGACLALSLIMISEAVVSVQERRKLLIIIGTTEVEGEARLLDRSEIRPGQKGIIFFKPHRPVLTFIGDRFIARLPTPQVTIGGGIVLDILTKMPGKKDYVFYDYLNDRLEPTPRNLVESTLRKSPFLDLRKEFVFSEFSPAMIQSAANDLIRSGIAQEYDNQLFNREAVSRAEDRIDSALRSYFADHPHINGLASEEIGVMTKIDAPVLASIIQLMCNNGRLVKKKNRYDLPGREIDAQGELKILAEEISRELERSPFTPPSIDELIGGDTLRRQAFDYLIASGEIVKIGGGLAFHIKSWRTIIDSVKSIINSEGSLAVSALREKLHSSRKYIVPILEETDRLGLTLRHGDVRLKGINFEKI
jgi:selenocysteine-specific elongation factor